MSEILNNKFYLLEFCFKKNRKNMKSVKGLLHCFSTCTEITGDITGIVLFSIMSKTARKNSKGLKSYRTIKF